LAEQEQTYHIGAGVKSYPHCHVRWSDSQPIYKLRLTTGEVCNNYVIVVKDKY